MISVRLKIIKMVINNKLENFGEVVKEGRKEGRKEGQYLIARITEFFMKWNNSNLLPQGWNVEIM
jgi:hypothetical protein